MRRLVGGLAGHHVVVLLRAVQHDHVLHDLSSRLAPRRCLSPETSEPPARPGHPPGGVFSAGQEPASPVSGWCGARNGAALTVVTLSPYGRTRGAGCRRRSRRRSGMTWIRGWAHHEESRCGRAGRRPRSRRMRRGEPADGPGDAATRAGRPVGDHLRVARSPDDHSRSDETRRDRDRPRRAVGPGLPARRRRAGRRARHGPDPAGPGRRRHAAAGRTGCRASSPAARAGCSAWRCRRPTRPTSCVYAYFTAAADNRIVRFRLDGGAARGDLRRHRQGRHPQRRPDRVRPGRHALRRHRRRRRARRAQNPAEPERQDPADDPGRRARAGQPDRRLAGLQPRATATCRASPGTPQRPAVRAPSSARTPSTRST